MKKLITFILLAVLLSVLLSCAEKTVTVTFDIDGGEFISGQLVQEVQIGESAVAPIITKEGHTLTWDKPLDNITSNQTITAVWTVNTYTIFYETTNYYIINPMNSTTVNYLDNFCFTVAVNCMWVSDIIVKSNVSVLMCDSNQVYSIQDINEDKFISVELIVETFDVILPSEQNGYTIIPTSDSSVEYGSSYSFTVSLFDNYSQSNITVKANGIELLFNGEEYIISNIKCNQTISIYGVELNTYTITPLLGAAFVFTGNSTVQHGNNYSFKITQLYGSLFIVKANNQEIYLTDDVYIINNVASNQTITIEEIPFPSIMSPSIIYTVEFVTNTTTSIDTITQWQGLISPPSAITRQGYSFAGWYKDPQFSSEWNFSTDIVTSNITLYAKWNINLYTITFVTDSDDIPPITQEYNSVLSLPLPTKKGYEFVGWITDQRSFISFDLSVMPSRNLILYASWIVEQLKIIFDSNGGSFVASIICDGETISQPESPTKAGFEFKYWYELGTPLTEYLFDTIPTESITLYALWQCHFDYIEFNDGYAITGINSSFSYLTQYFIPHEIDGIPVIKINDSAFSLNGKITDITIPSSVKIIGDMAFLYCTNLQRVTINEGLVSIGNMAFAACPIVSISIPSSVQTIDCGAFSYCAQLRYITFTEGSLLTTIERSVFASCSSLTEITIPPLISTIVELAFDSCISLVKVYISVNTTYEDLSFLGCNTKLEIIVY